jgi:hypothetical protein
MAEPIWQDRIEEDAELFEGVEFLVNASDTEKHFLWEMYHYKPRFEGQHIKDWKQISMGHGITIGHCDGRPVCVSIFYAILDGHKVAFYDGTSQVVDHKMVEQWLKHHTLEKCRWDNGTRWAHTNAMNFHHCLHYTQGR